AAAANQSELAAICALIAATPVLSRRAEAKLQTQRIAALRQSGLFDAQTYALTNPDLAEAGIDPAEHYIRFGLVEGRALRPRPVVQALSEPQIAEETDHE
ncbi:MAG: hypothetical protein JKX69_02825, partial [Rhodobacteraceae bacterium]|nr:hypothetical protein [Paracoccaceae bacterium]